MTTKTDIEFDLSFREYEVLAVISYIENQTPTQLVETHSKTTDQAELEWAAKRLIDRFSRSVYA